MPPDLGTGSLQVEPSADAVGLEKGGPWLTSQGLQEKRLIWAHREGRVDVGAEIRVTLGQARGHQDRQQPPEARRAGEGFFLEPSVGARGPPRRPPPSPSAPRTVREPLSAALGPRGCGAWSQRP